MDNLAAGLGAGAAAALERLRARAVEGLPVFLVGGPVRDLLLGATVKDLDFTVEGDAPAEALRLAEVTGGKALVHQRFGTATVRLGGDRVDLVTARRESYPRAGALPEVTPGSIGDDLARRDFSINAIALPLFGHPRVVDPMGGLGDLQSGAIRTLHERSFTDDPTRIFRAVRYEQRLRFAMDPATMAQLRAAVADGALESVEGDRLRHELERCFEEELPVPPLVRAVELGLLDAICPGLAKADPLRRLGIFRERPAPSACLAALACALDAGTGDQFVRRLRLPEASARLVRDTIELRNTESELSSPSIKPSVLAERLDVMDRQAVEAWAKLTERPAVARNIRRYQAATQGGPGWLSGNHLLAMGVPRGPELGEYLRGLREARLDGRVETEEDERALVLAWINQADQSEDA